MKPSADLLKKLGCLTEGIDDPQNGVCLSDSKNGGEHNKTKSDELYYSAVNRLFIEAVNNLPGTNDCEKAKKALDAIKKSINPVDETNYGKFGTSKKNIIGSEKGKTKFDFRKIKWNDI